MKDYTNAISILGERLIKGAERVANAVVETCDAARREIKDNIAAVKDRDPAAESDLQILLTSSGVHAILAHRVAHKLHKNGKKLPARVVSQVARHFTGIEIHPGATIGRGLLIDHGMGVVIGETAEIGDNCTIYQGVTLGGTGKDQGKRHPTLRNNVMVGAGAKVLGPVEIGDNAKIASNAVVLKDIPADTTAVGIPARVVRKRGEKVSDPLDHIHIPDPVAQEIAKLKNKLGELEEKLSKVEKSEKNGEQK